MLSIDWHDFAIVETIEFEEGEEGELPPPMSLKQLITLARNGYVREEAGGEAAAAAEGEAPAGARLDRFFVEWFVSFYCFGAQ